MSQPISALDGVVTIIKNCSYCSGDLQLLVNLGCLPPVNVMDRATQEFLGFTAYPLTWAKCKDCKLVQILEELDGSTVFPDAYPYLSGTTRILRQNFVEQFNEINAFLNLDSKDLIVDIGSNDGTLLSNYKSTSKILGVEPTGAAAVAQANGIETIKEFFSKESEEEIVKVFGRAKVVTACNVFAHIPNLANLMSAIYDLMTDEGVFISESHYLFSLVETLQFDTIYHEHLRYYSLEFLTRLFDDYGMDIIRVKRIPTHGGSIRVWAAKKGVYSPDASVDEILNYEKHCAADPDLNLEDFVVRLLDWRQGFRNLISKLKSEKYSIAAIGAPSRASTLISFTGLSHLDLVSVGEIRGSHKIGRYMPGTSIPVVEESEILSGDVDYLLMLSWHIAEELMPKLRKGGFKGKFIIPLPVPKIVD
jgi:hypothetical protein